MVPTNTRKTAAVVRYYGERTVTPQEADKAQQWEGMDGATAWHLIERHASDWNEIGELMNAWLRANGGGPWVSCGEKMPEEDQTVAFVVRASNLLEYLNGRVLGGMYRYSKFGGGFSVPGMEFPATYWRPIPAAPSNASLSGLLTGKD